MKQRFSSLDVRAISHELHHTLAGTRLTNVYDLVPPSSSSSSSSSSASRALLLRFSRGQDKYQLVVDSGFRCHLTAYDARASAAANGGRGGGGPLAPSAFVARLRTFLNGRHVTAVAQVGTDRIVELRFSDGQLRLYLEFFAAGNIVLTNAEAKVLALQRTVAAFRSASLDVTLNVGNPYALAAKQNVSGIAPLTVEAVKAALQAAVAADAPPEATSAAAEVPQKKKKKKEKSLSRTLALAFTDLPQVLIDHVLLTSGFETTATAGATKAADVLADEARLDALFRMLKDARALAEGLTTAPNCQSYIIATKKEPTNVGASAAKAEEPEEPKAPPEGSERKPAGEESDSCEKGSIPASRNLDYIDFHPFSPRQFETDPRYVIVPLDSFNKAADEFYSHLQGLKANRQLHQQESVAFKKLEATKRDQAMRIESLQETQQLNARKAAAIEANQDWVQAAIDAVNEQLQAGTDWEDLAHLIENSAESNPVAALIKLPMRLADGVITLQISDELAVDIGDEDEDEDEEEEERQRAAREDAEEELLDVNVKLALSAWSNAREYYDQKRVAAVKEQKTKEVTSMALRNAEKKVADELKRVQKGGKPAPQLIRWQLWFEKFLWFISSEGHLVIAAKESQQCELMYRRYLRRGDIYVHADIRGSPGIIVVKNRPDAGPDAPVPPATLAQAGCLAVCASEAWDNKAGFGAYWVHANQVFKTTVGGDVLPLGTFDVRGEKNHLPPPQRILGFGLLFKISNARTANYTEETQAVAEDDGADEAAGGSVSASLDGADEKDNEEEGEMQPSSHDLADEQNGADNIPVGGDYEQEKKSESDEQEVNDKQTEGDKRGEGEKNGDGEREQEQAEEPDEPDELDGEADDGTDTQSAVYKGKRVERLRSSSPVPSYTSTAQTRATPTIKRGQKAKAKKLAKYKDQDEEDRAQAERLIGIAAGREKAEAIARAQAQRAAEMAAYEERRRAQRERQVQATRAFEEARQARMLALGGGPDEEEEDAGGDGEGSLDLVDVLVGRPATGDDIVEVVPVCAPWSALAKLKYKVKIQPGQTKKGRAMRDVLERWRQAGEAGRNGNKGILDEQSQDPERMWPREVELIRGLKMEEAANCVPVGKMTLMLAGGLGGGGGGGSSVKKGGSKGGSGKQAGQASGKKGGGKGAGKSKK